MKREFHRNQHFLLYLLAAVIITSLWVSTSIAATSTDGYWTDKTPSRNAAASARGTLPNRFRVVELTLAEFDSHLRTAPLERSNAGISISLPMPDGSFMDFRVEYSPIMAPALAARFPEIKTYIAVSKTDAATNARLDITPAGFHAIIFRPGNTIYIDPYDSGIQNEYMVYRKGDYTSNREPFHCLVTGQRVGPDHNISDHPELKQGGNNVLVGDTLRTYRLAAAATAEYTQFHGGTVPAGQAAIVTAINRVTGIYERELSVRLQLVANNDSLVFTNSATDDYTNSNGFAMLGENQAKIDTVIGTANYDIGHVFSTGGGGVAGLGVVCNASQKGRGVTGLGSPIGDPFYVDFVAHEIGHQFGGNHTFNGTIGSCAGGNRNASTAFEPGSGSTIQAYAGICGTDNIQNSSDDVFHTGSFDEMTAYIAGDGNCFASTATGNTSPTANAGANFTVPMGTPLVLDAPVATDPNGGDVLTYSWEQFDLGPAGPPSGDTGSGPIFRSFVPTLAPIRFLPQMSDILANTSTLGESLPTTDRNLTFRLTARDNVALGGGVHHDTAFHTVTTVAGPFEITSQDTSTTWDPGSTQTVFWNVARTDIAPVNCANVLIAFSDSGFPNFSGTILVAVTPNDGSEMVTAPVDLTTTGRVMVKCEDNIFFDINNAPITIENTCGNIKLDGGEQCDDGNPDGGDGCSSSCQVETGWQCTLPVPEVLASEAILDGSFEAGAFGGIWTEQSDAFGSPICNAGSCGLDGANSGDEWVWFGFVPQPETASVEQLVTIPPEAINLDFAQRIFSCDSPADFFRLLIDGNNVWERFGNDPGCFAPGYTPEAIDLATAPGGPYNDSSQHLVRFEAEIFATNGNASNFFIDDVSIATPGSPAQPGDCTLVGGNITVDKVTNPSGVHDPFTFTPSWEDDFILTDTDPPRDSGTLLPSSTSGPYSIGETVPGNWDLTEVTCVGNSAEDPGAIDLELGETVTCTLTNTQRGSIRVVEETDPPGSTKEFHFFPSWDSDFLLSAAGAPYVSASLPSSVIDGASYQISIQSEPDWILSEIDCAGFTSENQAAIFLDPGETVTCVITHTIKRGNIIVDKVTDPPGSPQSFSFTLTGNDVGQEFGLTHAATPHDSGDLIPTSENGTYSVVESLPNDWGIQSATCDDGSLPDAIDLAPNETVTCTFINRSDALFGSGFEDGEVPL